MADPTRIVLAPHPDLGITAFTVRDERGAAHRLLIDVGFSIEHPDFDYALGRTDLDLLWGALERLHDAAAG